MIKERYVNFEVAKLLRDKGFDECVHAWHNVYDKVNLDFRIVIDAPHLQIPAPTQAMACDWIEEEAFYPCLFAGAFLFGSLIMYLAYKFV